LRQQQDAVARNVANQATPGFKSGHLQFREYLTNASEDDVASSPMRSVVGAAQFIDFAPGLIKPTGNPLDAAIVEDGLSSSKPRRVRDTRGSARSRWITRGVLSRSRECPC
jgi:flagellar basal-body rod protein FlgF